LAIVQVPVKKVIRQVGSIPYISGGGSAEPLTLDNVEYLSRLKLSLIGTMTCVGTSANSVFSRGPAALIKNIALIVNGKSYVQNTDGFGLKLIRSIQHPGVRDAVLAPVASSASPGTANKWQAHYYMDVAVNELANDLRGVIWTQNRETQVQLQVIWNPESAAVNLGSGNTATFSGSLVVSSTTFDAPAPRKVTTKTPKGQTVETFGLLAQASVVHQIIKRNQPITQTGQNTVKIPKGQQIMRIVFAVKNNGDYNTDIVDQIQLNIQDFTYPLTLEKDDLRAQLVDRYRWPYDATTGLPYVPDGGGAEATGIYVLDFWETGTTRDLLDSSRLTVLDAEVQIDPGATLANASIDTYIEQLIPLSKPLTEV